jgi:iron complex transport system permease protein
MSALPPPGLRIFAQHLMQWRSPVGGRIAGPFALTVLGIALFVVMIFAVGTGAFPLNASQVIAILLSKIGVQLNVAWEPQQEAVLWAIRLPRVLLGMLAGASLAVAGAALQGLFRNPLADPVLIGVSGGAALAVAGVIVLGATVLKGFTQALGLWTLPLFGFLGGLASTLVIYNLARSEGRTSLATMLLAGIAVNAVAMSGIGVFTLIASDEQLRNINFWNFGSLGSASWPVLGVLAPPLLASFIVLWKVAPGLNALLLGEAEAIHIGYDVQVLKRVIIGIAALCAGFVVAVCGIIGFVALVAPHMVRLACGPDHRIVIPGAALLGGLLMVGADIIARTAFAPAELAIGIITALMGAPFFLALLLKQRGQLS